MKKIIGFIVVGIVLGGVGAYGVLRYVAGQRIEDEIAGFVEETAAIERIDYDHVKVGIVQSSIHLEKVRLKLAEHTQPIIIDKIDLAVPERGQSIPLRASADIRGFHLDANHGVLGPLGAELQDMGYSRVSGSATLAYQYDPEKKQLDLDTVILEIDKMGRLQFELELTRLDLPGLIARGGQPDVGSLLLALPTVGVGSGRFTYRDDSLVERLTRLNDKQSGRKQLDVWRRSLAKLAQTLKEQKKERIRHTVLVLREFIEHPELITITLSPPKSVPLLRFLWVKEPIDLIELLNIKVAI